MDLSLIRAKLASGALPWTDWDHTHIVVGGFGQCAGCDAATSPIDLAVECDQDGRRVTLHPDCYVMWEEARAANPPSPRS